MESFSCFSLPKFSPWLWLFKEIMASPIKDLVRSGETNRIEFKKTLPQPEKFAKALVSFANTRGGTILVGVQDDKRFVGISDFEEEKYVLEKAAAFFCVPEVLFEVVEEMLEGKTFMVIKVPESQTKPHYSVDSKGEKLLYVRSGDQCILASPLVARSLNMEKEGRDLLEKKPLSKNEDLLFKYLESKKRITLKDYAKLINVSKRRASKILIGLTLSGRLFMHDFEKTICFSKA